MKTILDEIYHGSGFMEKIPESKELEKVHGNYDALFEKLLKTLNKEQQKMLDDLFMLTGGLEYETGVSYFKAGFKFCMQLIMESMGK